MKIQLLNTGSLIRDLKREVTDTVQRLATETDVTVRQKTPIKTGRARRNWRTEKNPQGFTTENSVPYIERLEAGASKQAPRGIIGPTLTQVKGKFK